MANRVLMRVSDNEGYSPVQIKRSLTPGELLEEVENAITQFGEEALVILSNGQRYGAGYGAIPGSLCGDLFTDIEVDEEGER